ncbi:uncharacterized protein LOC144915125 [Branchiostoma floridae x Branchiostoma belcheri]
MRWQPLVIRWCLRHYRSNSKYEALSKSGFLRLPSGRTLRDYKNFSTAPSGWHISSLQRLRETFHVKKIKPHGNVGFLAFDEVKIKEGLIWEPNTNRLVGFVDVDEIPTALDLPTVRSPKSENVQCHEMNTGDTGHMCNNPFSSGPIFFMSDPPHLMKKLRNNLYRGDSHTTKCLGCFRPFSCSDS